VEGAADSSVLLLCLNDLSLFLWDCCCCCHRLAAHYDVEGVADSAVLLLAKFSGMLTPNIPKPRVAFGRDKKACAAVEMMFLIVTR
jgi:hypothetical protein